MLIINGRIHTMAGETIDPGCVLTENNKIKKVSRDIHESENADGIVINAKECWVMPGLIDAHCHIGILEEKMGIEGNDSNESTKPVTPYLKAIDAINPMDSALWKIGRAHV
jgi:imidazolonepropionase-like amidohydrolase